uniref:DNA-directed RNA polymerase n=1 Tax=Eudorina sp. NIES-3984 TaxID=1941220 RepID=A0A385KPA3_9CHLO|nr:RNA polymerase b''-subunit [Eudorina sp. NIES-3984]
MQNSNRKSRRIVHLCSTITGNFLEKMSCYSFLSLTGSKAKIQSYSLKALILNKKQTPPFFNFTFDKGRLKNLVSWTLENYGQYKTVELLEQLKKTGFEYATKAGISLGIDDLKIPPKKNTLLLEAEQLTQLTVHQYQRADITAVERFQRLIETWHRTSEQLKQEVINYFEETDILNPVYMMAFSGARGNISQVRQLVGMRGLMSDPQGQIIDFPIRSNFREGLTLTEYIISSYGARKGIVDTALRTANAGYLTRRLVDVAQHVIISHYDCGTHKGIFLTDMKEGNKIIVSVHNRIIGRVLARDIYKPNTNIKIASRNQEISTDLAFEITKITNRIFVRSALTCNTTKLLCQLCYGWSLAQGNLVSVGEAVGVIAAQSIGEPGTQLTMRTFHTGGVFSGDVSDEIRAPYNGFVYYENSIPGILIRALDGKILFLTKSDGTLFFSTNRILESNKNEVQRESYNALKTGKHISVNSDIKKYKIPAYTVLFIRNGEYIFQKQVIAQITSIRTKSNMRDIAELVIKSELEGIFYAKNLNLQKKVIGPKPKFVGEAKQNLLIDAKAMEIVIKARGWNFAWVLSGKRYELPLLLKTFPIIGDYITPQTIITRYNIKLPTYYKLKLNITNKTYGTDLQRGLNGTPFYFSRSNNVSGKMTFDFQKNKQMEANKTTTNNLFFSLDANTKNFNFRGHLPQSLLNLKKIKLFNLFTKYTKKVKSSLHTRFYLRNKYNTNLVFNKNCIPTIETTKIGKFVYTQKIKKRINRKKIHYKVENYIACNYRNLISQQQNIKTTPKISSSEKQLLFNNLVQIQTTMQKINLKQDLLFLNLKKIKYYKIAYFNFFNSQNSISIFGINILFLQRVNSPEYSNQNNKNMFEHKQILLKNEKPLKFNYNVDYNEVMLTPISLNSDVNLTKKIVLKRIKSSNYLLEWFSSRSIIDPKAFYYSNNFLFSKASFVKTLESLLKKKQEFNSSNRLPSSEGKERGQQALQRRRDLLPQRGLTQQTNNFEQIKKLNYAMSQNIKFILAENLLKIYKKTYKKIKKSFIKGIDSEALRPLTSIALKYKKEKNKFYDKQQPSLQTLVFKKWFKDSNILWNKQQKQSRFVPYGEHLKMKIDCFINNLRKNIYYFNKTLDSDVQKSKQQIKSINAILHLYYFRNKNVYFPQRGRKSYVGLKNVGIFSSNSFFNKKIKSYKEKSFFTANKDVFTFYNNKTRIKKYYKLNSKKANYNTSRRDNIKQSSTVKNNNINKTYIFEYFKLAQKKNGTKQILKHFKPIILKIKKNNNNEALVINEKHLTKKNLELVANSQTKNTNYTRARHFKKTNVQKQNQQKIQQIPVLPRLSSSLCLKGKNSTGTTRIFYTNLHKNQMLLLKKFFQQKIKIKKAQILNKKFKLTNKHFGYIYTQKNRAFKKNTLILLLLNFIKTLFVSYNYISPNKVQKQKQNKPQLQNNFELSPFKNVRAGKGNYVEQATINFVPTVPTSLNQKSTFFPGGDLQVLLLSPEGNPNPIFGNFMVISKRIKKELPQQMVFVRKNGWNKTFFSREDIRGDSPLWAPLKGRQGLHSPEEKQSGQHMLSTFSAKAINNTMNFTNKITDKVESSDNRKFFKSFASTTTWVYKKSSEKLINIYNNFLFPGHFILKNILFDKNKIKIGFNDKNFKQNKKNEKTKTKIAFLNKGIASPLGTKNLHFSNTQHYNTKKIRNRMDFSLKTKTFFPNLQKLNRILNIEKYKNDLIWIQNKKPRFLPTELHIKIPDGKNYSNSLKKGSNNLFTEQIIVNDMAISKNIVTTANSVNLNKNKTVDMSDKTNKINFQNYKIDISTINMLPYFIQFIKKKNKLTLKDLKKIKKEYEKVKTKNLFLSPSLSTNYLLFTQVHDIPQSEQTCFINGSQKPRLAVNINKERLKDQEKVFSNIKNKTFMNISDTSYKNAFRELNALPQRGITSSPYGEMKGNSTKNKLNSYPIKSVNFLNKKISNKFIKLEKNIKKNNKLQINTNWNIILCACTVKVDNSSNKPFIDLVPFVSSPGNKDALLSPSVYLKRTNPKETTNNTKLFVTPPSLSNFIKAMKTKKKLTTNTHASRILELLKNYNSFIEKTQIIKQPIFSINKNYKNKLFMIIQKNYKTNKNKKLKMGAYAVKFFDRSIYLTKNLFINRDELINKKHKQKKDINLFAKKPNFGLIINTYNISKKSKHKEEKNQSYKKKTTINSHKTNLANVLAGFIKKGQIAHKKYSHKNKIYTKNLISYTKPLFFELFFNNPSYCFTYTAKIQKEKTFLSNFKNEAKKLFLIPKQPCLNICFYLKYFSDLNPKIFKTNLNNKFFPTGNTELKNNNNHTKRSFSKNFFTTVHNLGTQLKSGISFNYYKDNIVARQNYFSPFEGELIYTKTYKNYLDLNPYENLKTGLMHLNNFNHQKTKEEKMRMAMFKYYLKTINKHSNQKKINQKSWSRFNLILTKKDLITLNYNQKFEKTHFVFSEIQKINTTQQTLRSVSPLGNIQHFNAVIPSGEQTTFNIVYNSVAHSPEGKHKGQTALMQSKSLLINNSKSLLNTENLHKNKVIYLQAYVNKLLQAYIKNNLKVLTIAQFNKENLFNKSYDFNLKNKWLKQNFSDSFNSFISLKQHCLVYNVLSRRRQLNYDMTNIVTSDIVLSQVRVPEQFEYKSIKKNTKDYTIKIWLPYTALKLNTNTEALFPFSSPCPFAGGSGDETQKKATNFNEQKENNLLTTQAKQIFFIPYTSKLNLKWINFKEKNIFTKNKIGFFFLKGNTFFNTSSKLFCNKIFLNSKIYNLSSKINFVFDKIDILQDTRYLEVQICLEFQKLHLNSNFLKLKPLVDKLFFKNFTYYKNKIYYLRPQLYKEFFYYKKQSYYTMYKSQNKSFFGPCPVIKTSSEGSNIDQWNGIPLQVNKPFLVLPYQKVLFYFFKPINTTTFIHVHQEIFVCNYRKQVYLSKQKINKQLKFFDTTICDLIEVIRKIKKLSLFFINLLKIVFNRTKNYWISIVPQRGHFRINTQLKILNNWQNTLFLLEDKKQNKTAESVQVLKKSGQLIHMNKQKITLRLGQPLVISPRSIIHASHGDFIRYKTSVITLTYQQLKTGDIVQGIPKVEQLFEARTTKRGRLFRDNVTNLLTGLFLKYFVKSAYLLRKNMLEISKKTNITYSQNLHFTEIALKQKSKSNLFVNNKQNQTIILALALHWSVKQSFYKIQQIIVDGILRVYRSQGVSIADKHVEIIVKQMTSKVRIINPNAAKLTDFSFSLQNINRGLDLEKNKQTLSVKHPAQKNKTKQTILLPRRGQRKSSDNTRKSGKTNQIFETKLLEQLLSNNLDGPSGLFPGEIVDIDFVENINIFLFKTSSFDKFNAENQTTFAIEPIKYEPIVLGITRASLEVESFLSAASFQQTTRVLSQAALYKKKDFLKGLKENIIIGNLIPAGTGYLSSLNLI